MVDVKKIYQVFDPAPLSAEQTDLYVDLDAVRGSSGLINRLAQNIRLSASPTCQLLAGHIGSGKSTELRRLQKELESGEGKLFTVFCKTGEDIEPNDVDFPDVLMAIIRQTAEQLSKRLAIKLKPGYFRQRLDEAKDILGREVDLTGLEVGVGIAKLSAAMKSSPNTRIEIRKLLEPRTNSWIEAANEVLGQAVSELSEKNYSGLVILVDGLDKIQTSTIAEHLLVERHAQMTGFRCHVVYTIPISLAYSCRESDITNLYRHAPLIVPMTMISNVAGKKNKPGFEKFAEIILKRMQKASVEEKDLFDAVQTRDKIIEYSGGQPRVLGTLIRDSIIEGPLPITLTTVEKVAKKIRHEYGRQLREEHWGIIRKVKKERKLGRTAENNALCMELLQSRAILQYENGGEWYGINPLLPWPSVSKKSKK
jgi:hypothetical protein